MNTTFRELPCGVSNFEIVARDNLYYVDKTPYVPMLERAGRFLFFFRPRRFGKSLFISMLRAYYDKACAADFDALFGRLWLGQHPTPLRGRFQVLYLDFSRVGGTSAELKDNFYTYFNQELLLFLRKYRDDYSQEVLDDFNAMTNVTQKITIVTRAAEERNIPLYLIIDEYDNFTNNVLNAEGHEVYHAITHAEGFYRDVFKHFKGTFERIFITGVSPVTIDDLTSGFNIGTNISLKSNFDKMLGMSTSEVRDLLSYYKETGQLPADMDVEATLHFMEPWYDNYCFSEECLREPERVFNTNMALYFVSNYISSGRPPMKLVDPGTRTDYAKMWRLLKLDELEGDRQGVLRSIAQTGQIVVEELHDMFPAHRLVEPEIFPSLLYYYGMLTMAGTRGERIILGIPNNNVRRQYYDYLLRECKHRARIDTGKLYDGFDAMAFDGVWRDALAYIAEAYNQQSSVRDAIEGERNIQGFFLAYLNLCSYYLCAPEVELRHGFCDFFLLPDMTHYQAAHAYIIELKYLPKKDYEARGAAQWDDAVAQIHTYAAAPRVQALRQGTQLHCIVMQFVGWDLVRMEEV